MNKDLQEFIKKEQEESQKRIKQFMLEMERKGEKKRLEIEEEKYSLNEKELKIVDNFIENKQLKSISYDEFKKHLQSKYNDNEYVSNVLKEVDKYTTNIHLLEHMKDSGKMEENNKLFYKVAKELLYYVDYDYKVDFDLIEQSGYTPFIAIKTTDDIDCDIDDSYDGEETYRYIKHSRKLNPLETFIDEYIEFEEIVFYPI